MLLLNRLLTGALLTIAASGCSNTIENPDASPPADAAMPDADGATDPLEMQYVLDFTSSEKGGFWLGGFNNVAFTVDLKQHSRKFVFSPLDGQTGPGLISSYDYAGCSNASTTLVEKHVAKLEAGDPARVEYVEIEMLKQAMDSTLKGVCFGYREPGGSWHWNFSTTPWTYNTVTERFHAKIPIQQGPLDALKLVFDVSPQHRVTTISFVARPEPASGP